MATSDRAEAPDANSARPVTQGKHGHIRILNIESRYPHILVGDRRLLHSECYRRWPVPPDRHPSSWSQRRPNRWDLSEDDRDSGVTSRMRLGAATTIECSNPQNVDVMFEPSALSKEAAQDLLKKIQDGTPLPILETLKRLSVFFQAEYTDTDVETKAEQATCPGSRIMDEAEL